MLRRLFSVAILAGACLSSSALWAVPLPKIEERPKPNRTVIPGTWAWNIETNKLGGEKADLWWSHHTDAERSLMPKNGAAVVVVTKAFDKIDLADLKATKFGNEKISGSDNDNKLQPGTVLAVRTTSGNYAKVRVVRYYRLHDFSFPGSEVLTEGWKQFVLRKPDRDFYHIEVEWMLYPSK